MFYTISSANLSLLQPGEQGKILSLPPSHTKEYAALTELGIALNQHLVVLKRHPMLVLEINQQRKVIPFHLSTKVRVRVFDSRIRYPPTPTITSEALIIP